MSVTYVVNIQKLEQIFKVYDEDKDGYVAIQFIGKLIRSARMFPNQENIEQFKKKADPKNQGKFSKQKFIQIALQFYQKEKTINHQDQLLKAFGFFDQDESGTLPIQQLKKIMDNFGQPLSIDQTEQILKIARKFGDDKLHYKDFIKTILSGKVD